MRDALRVVSQRGTALGLSDVVRGGLGMLLRVELSRWTGVHLGVPGVDRGRSQLTRTCDRRS